MVPAACRATHGAKTPILGVPAPYLLEPPKSPRLRAVLAARCRVGASNRAMMAET